MKIEITITGPLDNATAEMFLIDANNNRTYLGNLTASLQQLLVDIGSVYSAATGADENVTAA